MSGDREKQEGFKVKRWLMTADVWMPGRAQGGGENSLLLFGKLQLSWSHSQDFCGEVVASRKVV